MMRDVLTVLLFAAALASGIAAGIFFAFSTFVMRALARLPSREGIRAMQSINAAVLNLMFASVFVGTGAIAGLALVLSALLGDAVATMCIAIGAFAYGTGFIAVTMKRNVPLNEKLAAWHPDDESSDSFWKMYVLDWSRWNHLRTVAASVSMLLMIMALQL